MKLQKNSININNRRLKYMKKLLAGMIAAALVCSAGSVTAFAARGGRGCNYVDANGDGICDNSGKNCRFIDADGDGICDNYAQKKPGNGCGGRRGQGGGKGRCGR